MSELIDAVDSVRFKQRLSLTVFILLFAGFALLVMINVFAEADKAKHETQTEKAIRLLEQT